MEKMNINDIRSMNDISKLKQIKGVEPITSENVETAKTVKEVINASQETKKEDIKTEKVKEVAASVEIPLINKAYVAHGALEPSPTDNINAILKKYRHHPFDKFQTTAEYSKVIGSMGTSELHAHAVEVNVIPTSDKEKLIRNLELAFGTYINKMAPRIFPPSNLTVQNKEEIEAIIARKMPKRY